MYELFTYSKKNLLLEKKVALPGNPGSAPPPSPVYTIGNTKITQDTTTDSRRWNPPPIRISKTKLPQKGELHRHRSVVINQKVNASFLLFFSSSEDSFSPKQSFGHSYTSNLQPTFISIDQLLPPREL